MSSKEKTTPLTWIVSIALFLLLFYTTYNLFSGNPLFESKSSKCKTYASEHAKKLISTKLAILRDKNNQTQADLETIDLYNSWISNNAYSRDDYETAYNDCMR